VSSRLGRSLVFRRSKHLNSSVRPGERGVSDFKAHNSVSRLRPSGCPTDYLPGRKRQPLLTQPVSNDVAWLQSGCFQTKTASCLMQLVSHARKSLTRFCYASPKLRTVTSVIFTIALRMG